MSSASVRHVDRMLRFRDGLRATDADRDYYMHTKHKLTQREWRHVQHYPDTTTMVVQEIMDQTNATA